MAQPTAVTINYTAGYTNGVVTVTTTASDIDFPVDNDHLRYTCNGVTSTNAHTIPVGELPPGYHVVTAAAVTNPDWTITIASTNVSVFARSNVPANIVTNSAAQLAAGVATLFVFGAIFLG